MNRAAVIRGNAALATFLFVLLIAPFARAHQIGLSRGEYRIHGREIDAELVFSAADGPSEPLVFADAAPCASSKRSTEPTEEDGVRVRVHFACPRTPSVIRLDFIHGPHVHLAHLAGDVEREAAFDSSNREIRLRDTGQGTLLFMGIEHILTGWDHLAFLLGLVVVGGRFRSIVAAITAFTVAHSVTLALAVLDVVRGSALFVEPLIALSVLYVGVENFRVTSAEGRWRITFPFGLIHGFGFAGALQALALPRPRVPMALFSFNAGVEIGQLAVLAVVLPMLWVLRKSAAFRKWGVRAISAAVATAGAIWFVTRLAC